VSFEWPIVLVSLVVVPLLLGVHLRSERGRRRRAVTYSSVALIRAARPSRISWRRHLPVALVLAALTLLGLAAARPRIEADVPVAASSVILALDVSGSMCATDVEPNRLAAAQAAVRTFVRGQNSHTRIGIVVFSGFAQLTVRPTTDRGELLHAVDALTVGRGTTIGSAILKSVDAISQINPHVRPASSVTPEGGPDAGGSVPDAPAPGTHAPEIVVLLTDGANTTGIEPVDAAKVAAARGVRVYPIGFGTTHPTRMLCTPEQAGGAFGNIDPGFGGGAPAGGGGFLVADEPTLRQVATTTGGMYFSARDAGQLQDVLADLPRHVQIQKREIELTAGLAGLAAVLVLLSVAAAARWTAFPA
jgi:Ca-activated chloride channel homolog